MSQITRREFLKMGTGAAFMLGTSIVLSSCKSDHNVLGPADINATVSIISGNNLDHMTRDAIEAIGGIGSIVNEGETVFIKPNFVTFPWASTNNCFSNGEVTKTEIIIAVTEECLKVGAAEVIIGEGSHLPTFDWNYATTLDQSTDLVTAAENLTLKYNGKVTLACLEVDSPEWVEVPSRTYLEKIAIYSMVSRADRIISIPVAKTHSWAELTLGLKNFIGITPLERYGTWVNDSHWDRGYHLDHSSPEAIAQIYLDIVDAIKPDLTIVDFSIGIEGDGPTVGSGGLKVNMKERLGSWVVLASTDIMAADATTARIMSYNVPNVKQLRMGYDMGLGEIREESIEIVGERIENVRVDWLVANLRNKVLPHRLEDITIGQYL